MVRVILRVGAIPVGIVAGGRFWAGAVLGWRRLEFGLEVSDQLAVSSCTSEKVTTIEP
jgi:hypothetical protein